MDNGPLAELRRDHVIIEDNREALRTDLFTCLLGIHDALIRCCRNYEMYRNALCDMRDRFFGPMGMEMDVTMDNCEF